MEYSAFLQLGDIRGESRTAPWVGWIPLASASSPVGQRPADRDIVVVAPHGIHSVYLVKAAADGRVFENGEIAFVRNGSKSMAWKLEKVMITNYQLGGAVDGVPIEAITLAPGELKVALG